MKNATFTRRNLSLILAVAILVPASAYARGGHGGGTGGGQHSFSSSNRLTSTSRNVQSLKTMSNNQPNFQKQNTQSVLMKFNSKVSTSNPPNLTKLNGTNLKTTKNLTTNNKLTQLQSPKTTGKNQFLKTSGKGSNKHRQHRRQHRRHHFRIAIGDDGDADGDDDGDDEGEEEVAESEATPTLAAPEKPDLELLGATMLDEGSDEDLIGPRYRIVIRNSGNVAVIEEFEVTLLAGMDETLADDLPQNSKRIKGLEAGKTIAVDIRLPYEVNDMGEGEDGDSEAFSYLFVQIDRDGAVDESNKDNNSGVMDADELEDADDGPTLATK